MRRRRERFCLMEGKVHLAVDSGVPNHYGEQRVRSHELILSRSCRLGPSILSLGLCLSLGLGPVVWVLPVSGSRRLGHSCLWVPSSGSLTGSGSRRLGPSCIWVPLSGSLLSLGPVVWVLPVSGCRRLGHSCLRVPSSGSLFSLGPASLWDLLSAAGTLAAFA